MKRASYLSILLSVLHSAAAAQGGNVSRPPSLQSYVYGAAVSGVSGPAAKRQAVTGRIQVGIKLQDPPLVVAVGVNAKQNGIAMTAAQQIAYLAQIKQKQDAVMAQVAALGGVELGRVSKAHNALAVSVDASTVQAIHGISGVLAVRPLADYQVSAAPVPDIATTDAYIGAAAVQAGGVTGSGIRVALLDTGIDYTHYNLGGSGNVADYATALAAAAGTPPPSLFPPRKWSADTISLVKCGRTGLWLRMPIRWI